MSTTITSSLDTYKVIGEYGKGGMGVTYEVERASTGEHLILKKFLLSAAKDWKAVELFEREAKVLSSIDHERIPRYVDYFVDEDEGAFCLVQALVPGKTLQRVIDDKGGVTTSELDRYLRDCLGILAYLHDRVPPVVHRDISPKNIIVNDRGAHLVDFGAVKDAASDSTSYTVVGTFGYMAPEQIHGQAETGSDMYGLGMSFVALATGRAPSSLPLDPSTGQPDARGVLELPERLKDVLLDMIRPGVAERLSDAREALDRLDGKVARASTPTPRPAVAVGPAVSTGPAKPLRGMLLGAGIGVPLGLVVLSILSYLIENQGRIASGEIVVVTTIFTALMATLLYVTHMPRLGALTALVVGLLTALKPVFWPIIHRYPFMPSGAFGLTSETHLFFLLPGIGMIALGILLIRSKRARIRDATDRVAHKTALGTAALWGVLVLFAFLLSSRSGVGELRTLGSWTQGHGKVTSAITGALTGSYALLTEPNGVEGIAFSPDGTSLVSTSGGDELIVWDPATGAPLSSASDYSKGDQLVATAFTPSGKQLVQVYREQLFVWDTATWKKTDLAIQELFDGSDWGYSFQTPAALGTASGDRILVAFWSDGYKGDLVFYDSLTKKLVAQGGTAYAKGECVAYNAPGTIVAAVVLVDEGGPRYLAWWQVGSKRSLGAVELAHGEAKAVAVDTAGGRAAVVTDSDIRVYELAGGKEMVTFSLYGDAYTFALEFSPIGSMLAMSKTDGVYRPVEPVVYVYDVAKKKELFTFEGHGAAITSLAWNPTATILASASRDQTVKLWKTE